MSISIRIVAADTREPVAGVEVGLCLIGADGGDGGNSVFVTDEHGHAHCDIGWRGRHHVYLNPPQNSRFRKTAYEHSEEQFVVWGDGSYRPLEYSLQLKNDSGAETIQPLDLIAVGAHPDDVEIAIGGTLAKLVKQGHRVGIVDLTDGEPTPGSPGPEVRLAEAQEAAKILGVQMRLTLDLPNRRLFDCYEARVALAKVFRKYRPKVVLGIYGKTPMASPDHWQAMQITDAAVFYSRLSKWDAEFGGLPVHTIQKLIWYPLGWASATHETPGSFVIDIGDTLETKLASIRAYQTQFPPGKDRVFRMVESQAKLLGGLTGVAAGELLISPHPPVVGDLLTQFSVP